MQITEEWRQSENLVFAMIAGKENIRLITRSPLKNMHKKLKLVFREKCFVEVVLWLLYKELWSIDRFSWICRFVL